MPMRVTIDLSDRDLRYFRNCLRTVREGSHGDDEPVVIRGAKRLVTEALREEVPEFVRERIEQLEHLIEMLEDKQWRLEGADRGRVLNALAYFVDPDDLIPDRVPGIGYLDDAIMIELVVQELRHELEAYADFCRFRDEQRGTAGQEAEHRLEVRRDALQARMRRRRRRVRGARRTRGGSKLPIGLW